MDNINENKVVEDLRELIEKQKEINEYILKTKRLEKENDKI
jgi:uncharacterized protein Yka (UPF0111/DUF47 family)